MFIVRKSPRFVAFLAAAALLSSCGKTGPVLARVNSDPITETDFQQELASRGLAQEQYLGTLPGRKEMLELLVRRRVVLAEAKRAAFLQRPDVKKKLADMDKEFEKQRREARDRVLIGDFFRYLQERDLKITDTEVRDFYERENEVKASHILLSDPETAKKMRQRLLNGESFEELAKKYSEDPATGRQGGSLGYIIRGTLVPEFENALFALRVGEVSDVVASPYGHHLIKKTQERKLSALPFEQTAERIRAVVEKQKFQAWIDKAKSHYKIFTDLDRLSKMKLSEEPAAGGPSAGPAN
ncbi:MAG TPA: peptidylprolyl isomerase [Elusimicrobiota bacterium]|nr:peptidylprolyl isomerase [Elusimicrobiota bacterium]